MNNPESSLLAMAEGRMVAKYLHGPNPVNALVDGLNLLGAWVEEGGDEYLSELYAKIIQETTPENTNDLRRELTTLDIGHYSSPLTSHLERNHPYSHALRNLIDSL